MRPLTNVCCRSLVVILGALVLAGCGQSTLVPLTAVPAPVELPQLPGPDAALSPIRSSSAPGVTVDGDGFAAEGGGGNYSPGGDTYAVVPGGGEDVAFAQYNLPFVDDARPVTLSINAGTATAQGGAEALPMSYWLGIADFTTFRWEWHGPLTASTTIPLNTIELRERYVSANGTMSFVVFTTGGAPSTPENPQGLNGVTISTSVTGTSTTYFPTKPHLALVDSLAAGDGKNISAAQSSKRASALDPSQYVTVIWEHVQAMTPEDQQNEAFQYQVFRQGSLDPLPVPIGSELAPEERYVDPLDNASVAEPPIPGETYEYFVRAINPNGFTPLNSAGTIQVQLLPPAGVSASSGAFDDHIQVRWTKAEGASSYNIYRDDQLLATVGNVALYDDTTVPDLEEHLYEVQSVNPFAVSVRSTPAPGHMLQAIEEYTLAEITPPNGVISMVWAAFNPLTNQPVASYVDEGQHSQTQAGGLNLYEFDPMNPEAASNGWVYSMPVSHTSYNYGMPAQFLFTPTGDLGIFYSRTTPDWEYHFVLRTADGIVRPTEFISGGGGWSSRLSWDSVNEQFGMVSPDYFDDVQSVLVFTTGTPSNFVRPAVGTPLIPNGVQTNYDFAFDSNGVPYIAYVNVPGDPLNVWVVHAGTWQTLTLDPSPCYGVNIAPGSDGKMFILYQHPGELRISEGMIDPAFNNLFTDSQVTTGQFTGYLYYYTTALAVDGQDQPHIIFPTDLGAQKLWYWYRDGQGWTAPAIPLVKNFFGPGQDYQPEDGELDWNDSFYIDGRRVALALDANGKPLCVYNHDIYTLKAKLFR
jgi:hypothetical protein